MPPTSPSPQNPWTRRLRRLIFFSASLSTLYLASSYVLDRMREARIRAQKEKRERDLMKSHFTSLLSTLSFTLYALLPTLHPQLFDAYPVEATSQALQGMSASGLLSSSVTSASGEAAPDGSLLLQNPPPAAAPESPTAGTSTAGEDEVGRHGAETAGGGSGAVDESWASEFQQHHGHPQRDQRTESISGSETSGLLVNPPSVAETDDAASSTLSQSISLPPTSTSSMSGSPPSDSSRSNLHASPPRPSQHEHHDLSAKSKKELWRDLKLQTLTRTLTTAYLVPLLYLLTASQLSLLARQRYLADVKSGLPADPTTRPSSQPNTDEDGSQTPRLPAESPQHPTPASAPPKDSWFSYFSVTSMGLDEFIPESERLTSILPNPLDLLPQSIASRLPALPLPFSTTTSRRTPQTPAQTIFSEALEDREAEVEAQRAEDERAFLSYSWWILHEGWKGVAERVEREVERVFGGLALKRELSVPDWDNLIREVRAGVETELSPAEDGRVELYSFIPHLLPLSPLPPQTASTCPLPASSESLSPYLLSLLAQTREHLDSPDGRYLLERGVSAMLSRMMDTLSDELYAGNGGTLDFMPSVQVQELEAGEREKEKEKRRLVDCLPVVGNWGKGVWEGVPDGGVEALLALREYEAFTALVFGDWAPRD